MATTHASSSIAWSQVGHDYWRQSQRPLASLAFTLPLLVLYEGGVLLLGPQAVRNGADVWLRQILDLLGFGQYFFLPVLMVAVLLAWHYTTRERWQLSAAVLYAMFAESAVLGLALVGLARAEGLLVHALWNVGPLADGASLAVGWLAAGNMPVLGRLLGFIGAGVYEELLFRLLLLPPISAAAVRLGARRGWQVACAVVLTSLVFALAHYVGPRGQEFDAFSFSFRFSAGAFFALLFVFRGFGIAAGTHALYDIFVSFG